MARYLKNPTIGKSFNLAAQLPIVPSSSYGDSPVNGLIRFNQSNSRIEFYYNGAWSQVSKIGTVPIAIDTTSTLDGTNQYSLANAPAGGYTNGQENNVLVFVGGVQQQANVNYNFSIGTYSNTLYLSPSTSGDAGQPIIVIHNINSTNVPA